MRPDLDDTTMGRQVVHPGSKRRCSSRGKSSKWSQLPTDLIELVLKKLPTIMDIMRIKAVCSPWRSTAKSYTSSPYHSPPQNPCIMFLMKVKDDEIWHRRYRSCVYDPIGNTVYQLRTVFSCFPFSRCMGSSYGWLLFFNESSCIVGLYNPISRARFRLPFFRELSRIRYCSSPLKAIVSFDPSSNKNFVVALVVGGDILFYKHNVKAWTELENSYRFTEIMFHNDHLYSLTSKGSSLAVWDCRKWPPVTSMRFKGSIPEGKIHRSYLAKSITGEVLRVVKLDDNKKPRVLVQKLDTSHVRWETVETLSDQVLFVIQKKAISLLRLDISGCEEYSVYDFPIIDHASCDVRSGYYPSLKPFWFIPTC
ncbi:F-box protein At2g26160-like [Argentina anserina]|uniref:F-box protein At2g26160-like n=1 Tax=Argentina anserina TaxID=57926 RepID=UPI00217687E4|nr:F-box protein At2g26160-like [Potentilla anserina]